MLQHYKFLRSRHLKGVSFTYGHDYLEGNWIVNVVVTVRGKGGSEFVFFFLPSPPFAPSGSGANNEEPALWEGKSIKQRTNTKTCFSPAAITTAYKTGKVVYLIDFTNNPYHFPLSYKLSQLWENDTRPC